MNVFEISMVIMAAATVASAVSTLLRNLATMRKMGEAERIVKDLHSRVGAGAEVGALIGAGIEALLKPASQKRIKQLEATQAASAGIVDALARALEQARAERDAAIKAAKPGILDVLVHNARALLARFKRKG